MAADKNITQLTEDTSPNSTDIMYTVRDPGGTPLDRKVTLTNAVKSVGVLKSGLAGGQTLIGGTASGEDLKLVSTSNATRGSVILGNAGASAYDEANDRLGLGTASPNTTLDTQGGHTWNVTAVAAATYDLLITDHIVHVTYTGTGAVTSLTLPTAQTTAGRVVVIKDAGGNAGTNNITVDTEGAETIDGAATAVINGDYDSINLYSDGSNWFIF